MQRARRSPRPHALSPLQTQLDKLHGQGARQAAFLDLGPACKHLPLLPIAMPALHPSAQSLTQAMNGGGAAAAAAAPAVGGRSGPPATDLVEAFSFATLAVARPAAEGAALTPEGGGMAAAAMSTLESLGARFQDSTAAFGSMANIGLDVSAMQQQLGSTFGNVLQPPASVSSLFSFGKQS